MRNALVLSAALMFAPAIASASTWEADPTHSEVGFKVRHLMISDVAGRFNKFSAKIDLDDKDPSKSKVDVDVDVSSIDTRDPKRDEHLKSPDFFEAAKFPKMTFKSKTVTKAGSGYKVTGDLTMHGVTKPVTLDVAAVSDPIKDPWGMTRRAATASAKVNRKDFGLNWNKALDGGGVVVGDDVNIIISVELVEKK